jgi:hypothetical protein
MHLSRETAQRVTRFYRLRAIVNRPGQAAPPRNGPPSHTQASRLDA